MAVDASIATNYEFTGIDFVVNKSGNYFLLEVNYPNDFSTPAKYANNIDIAYEAIKHLYKKAKSR